MRVGRTAAIAGRMTPDMRPRLKIALVATAPELPAETKASARPSLTSLIATLIEQSFFFADRVHRTFIHLHFVGSVDYLKFPRLDRRLRIFFQILVESVQFILNGGQLADEQYLHIGKTGRRLNRADNNLFGGVVAPHRIKGNSSHGGNPF